MAGFWAKTGAVAVRRDKAIRQRDSKIERLLQGFRADGVMKFSSAGGESFGGEIKRDVTGGLLCGVTACLRALLSRLTERLSS